jgi:hypothetical protein
LYEPEITGGHTKKKCRNLCIARIKDYGNRYEWRYMLYHRGNIWVGRRGALPRTPPKNFLKKVFWIFKNFYEKEFANL